MVLRLAWRSLWRHPRRTLFTASAMGIGLALLLVFLGIGDGSHLQMIDATVELSSGHVLVEAKGYGRYRAEENLLDAEDLRRAREWLDTVRKEFGIRSVLPRIHASGLLATADGSCGIGMLGLDGDLERPTSRFAAKITQGNFVGGEKDESVVLGAGAARRLEAGVGDKAVLTLQAPGSHDLVSALVRIGGIVETGLPDVDTGLMLAPIGKARAVLGLGEAAHQLAVLLDDSRNAERLRSRAREALPGLEIVTWREDLPELDAAIRLDDGGNYLYNSVFFVLIGFTVLNTLLMSVLERRREFALMQALGVDPGLAFRVVALESVLLATLAIVLGGVLGLAGHAYLATRGLPISLFTDRDLAETGFLIDPVLYSVLSLRRVLQSCFWVYATGLLLGLLPALRAARRAPVRLLATQ